MDLSVKLSCSFTPIITTHSFTCSKMSEFFNNPLSREACVSFFDNLHLLDMDIAANQTDTPIWLTTAAKHQAWLNVFAVILYSVIAMVGTIGNLLTICAILICKKHRTLQNAYISSLAISDLLVCISVAPYTVWSYIKRDNPTSKSSVCHSIGAVQMAMLVSTMLHLAAIAVNRYVCMMKPAHAYMTVYTWPRVIIDLCIIWLLSCITIIPGLVGFGGFGYNDLLGVCSITDEPESKMMILLIFVFPITLPSVIVVLYCYIRILHHFYMSSRLIHTHRVMVQPTSTNRITPRQVNGSCRLLNNTNRSAKEITVIKNLCTVFMAVIICWMPGNLLYFFHDHGIQAPLWLWRAFAALAISNSCMNVFIYAGMNPSFRRTYMQIISFRYRSVNNV